MVNDIVQSTERIIRNMIASGAISIRGPSQALLNSSTAVTADAATRDCFLCGQPAVGMAPLIKMKTTQTKTTLVMKIAEILGSSFEVTISLMDVLCERCVFLINLSERLDEDKERARNILLDLLNQNYGLFEDEGDAGAGPLKQRKLNNGTAKPTDPAGTQKKTTCEVQLSSVYKCPTCIYKTSDVKLFNIHYQSCQQRLFQCNICQKIHPNYGALKVHMMKQHQTLIDKTCGICQRNFSTKNILMLHMNLCKNKPVDSEATSINPTVTVHWCPYCKFISTDKVIFGKHLEKHNTANRPAHYECGTCHLLFPEAERLIKHVETHEINVEPAASEVSETSHPATSQPVTAQNIINAASQTATNPFFDHHHVQVYHRENINSSVCNSSSNATVEQPNILARSIPNDELIITPLNQRNDGSTAAPNLSRSLTSEGTQHAKNDVAGIKPNLENLHGAVAASDQKLPVELEAQSGKTYIFNEDGELSNCDDESFSDHSGKRRIVQDAEEKPQSLVLKSDKSLDVNTMVVEGNADLMVMQHEIKEKQEGQLAWQCDLVAVELEFFDVEDVIIEVSTSPLEGHTIVPEPVLDHSEEYAAMTDISDGVSEADDSVESAATTNKSEGVFEADDSEESAATTDKSDGVSELSSSTGFTEASDVSNGSGEKPQDYNYGHVTTLRRFDLRSKSF